MTGTIRRPERWLAWARRLAERGSRVAGRNRVAMLYLRPARRAGAAVRTHDVFSLMPFTVDLHVAFANRIADRFATMEHHHTRAERTDSVRERTVRSVSRLDAIYQPERQNFERQDKVQPRDQVDSFRQTIARLIERTQRREERVLSRDVRLVHVSPLRPSQVETGEAPDRGRGAPREAAAPQSTAPFEWRTPPASPVNVDQITENVMRQLDRRIDAWRERTGRR